MFRSVEEVWNNKDMSTVPKIIDVDDERNSNVASTFLPYPLGEVHRAWNCWRIKYITKFVSREELRYIRYG